MPGYTRSERIVGEAFRQLIPQRTGRVLVSSFASNVHRMQQAIDVAVGSGRKVAVVGRSMRKNLNIARNLGYIDVPDDAIVRPVDLDEIPASKQLILCTGSQGEPMSALTRIAYRDHPAVQVDRGDTVIISARPVPGNELRVHDSINQLAKLGAEVLHEQNADVHVSGHARAEELRQLLGLVRPRYLMPIHGEYRMQAAHARLGQQAGIPAENLLIAENGSVVELEHGRARIVDNIGAGITFVDRLGGGDVSDVALRDRRTLAEDGVLIIVATLSMRNGNRPSTPELIFRGFSAADGLADELRSEAEEIVQECLEDGVTEIKLLQEHLHDGVGQLVYDRTNKRPMILPVLVEV
jgi:ribonuclease J